MWRACLWCLRTKGNEIITSIHVCLFWLINFNSIKMVEKNFLQNQGMNIVYPNEEIVFMVPNNKKKGDYNKNPCLSYLMDEL